MKKIRSNYQHSNLTCVFVLGCILLSSISCKETNNTAGPTTTTATVDKVQAVMKVQPFAYDPDDKTKVSGAYLDKIKVNIPKSLSGQNKWFMFEGPVLENDKVAYRFYADARHRFDIYGKKVADLVMDTVSWKYHDIMDWGSDILKVGNSLGIGSPAILYQDSLYALEAWDQKTVEILADDSNSATVRTIFTGLAIGDQKMNIQQDWTLSAGNFDTSIEIKRIDGALPSDMRFATGIVSHLPEEVHAVEEGQYYSYTWGKQSYHKQDLGMAIIAEDKYKPQAYKDNLSHVTLFAQSENGVTYHFMAIWADGVGNVKTESSFVNAVKEVASRLK